MAEWSCSGLQSRVRRFDSDLSLHYMRRCRRRAVAASSARRTNRDAQADRLRRDGDKTPAPPPYRSKASRRDPAPACIDGCSKTLRVPARVAEPVDAADLKSAERKFVRVRVPPRAPGHSTRRSSSTVCHAVAATAVAGPPTHVAPSCLGRILPPTGVAAPSAVGLALRTAMARGIRLSLPRSTSTL